MRSRQVASPLREAKRPCDAVKADDPDRGKGLVRPDKDRRALSVRPASPSAKPKSGNHRRYRRAPRECHDRSILSDYGSIGRSTATKSASRRARRARRSTCSHSAVQMTSSSCHPSSSAPSPRVAHGQAPRAAHALLPIEIARRTVRGSLASMMFSLMKPPASPWRCREELAHMQIATCEHGRHFVATPPRLVSGRHSSLRRATSSRFSAVTERGCHGCAQSQRCSATACMSSSMLRRVGASWVGSRICGTKGPHRRPTPTVGSPVTR
jgi:hypothetical protein